jgi:M6 family metalloprotease-like protein
LYDADEGGATPPNGFGAGLGSYSLMANSWGFDGTQNFPPLMDAWCKIRLGWMQATPITASGTYSINSAATTPQAYIITHVCLIRLQLASANPAQRSAVRSIEWY